MTGLLRPFRARLLPPLIATVGALALALLLMIGLGFSARDILHTVWSRVLFPADWNRRLASWAFVLQHATPILLTGLAVMVAFRASVWNIGAQGQYLVGAVTATAAGLYIGESVYVTLPVLLVASMIAGALLASVAAILHWLRNVPVVLSTLLLNFIALELLRYLVQGPMRAPTGQAKSLPLPIEAQLPFISGTALHVGFVAALVAAVVAGVVLNHTTFGFRLRVVGENPTAARFAGIHVPRVSLGTLFLSGALAGLAGGIETAGVTHELLLSANDAAFGFTGIAVALLGRLTPTGVVAAALFFGLLNRSFTALQAELNVPYATSQALQGLIILLMLVLTHRGIVDRLRFPKRGTAA